MNIRLRKFAYLAMMFLAGCVTRPPNTPTSTDLERAIRDSLGGDWQAHYFDAAIDLNGDGNAEVVALVAGPMICGTGGCPVFVFTPDAGRYRLVSRISVTRPPVRVSPRSAQGWRNLVVGIGGGGIPGGNAELKFAHTGYPGNPTVPPAEPVSNLEGTEILIPKFKSYKNGKTLPARSR